MIQIYHHPNCSSCKKAIKFLKERKIAFELVDLREKAPSKKELGQMLQNNYSGAPKKLFNSSGAAYREGDFKNKISNMSESDMLAALASDGLLVKRPFVLLPDGKGLVGFKQEQWEALLEDMI